MGGLLALHIQTGDLLREAAAELRRLQDEVIHAMFDADERDALIARAERAEGALKAVETARERIAPAAREGLAALVEQVVSDLFTNGEGERAARLMLIDRHGYDLGGWGEAAVTKRLTDALAAWLKEQGE